MSTKLAAMHAAEERSAGKSIDDYPIRLFAEHMAEIFGISVKRFYALDADGHFDFALNRPRVGRKSWSRERVKQWDNGTLTGLTDRRLRRVG